MSASNAWQAHKYLPLIPADRDAMLGAIGVSSVDALFEDVPPPMRLERPLDLPPPLPEAELMEHLRGLADRCGHADRLICFLGGGAYDHHIPSVVWHLAGRAEFTTAYTPYQAEVMQGELQAAYEYQTMLCELTGMDVANASMYDGASALAEAAVMARDLTRRGAVVVSTAVHPHYRAALHTYTRPLGIEVVEIPHEDGVTPADAVRAAVGPKTAAVLVQSPNVFGCIEDGDALADAAHGAGGLLVVAVAEPISLGLLRPPGAFGADIVAGEGQPLGNPLNFGGPYLGMLATREAFVRRMPGRLVGMTTDRQGRRGFVLTLQTREQHIRREKATSNICTNAGLCALAFTVHLTLLGEAGFRRLAEINHAKASELADRVTAIPGVKVLNESFFNEFTVRLPKPAAPVVEALAARRILGGLPVSRLIPNDPSVENLLLLAATETTTEAGMGPLVAALKEGL